MRANPQRTGKIFKLQVSVATGVVAGGANPQRTGKIFKLGEGICRRGHRSGTGTARAARDEPRKNGVCARGGPGPWAGGERARPLDCRLEPAIENRFRPRFLGIDYLLISVGLYSSV